MLQTTQPGIGSAVIQVPSFDPRSSASAKADVSTRVVCGGRKKTCRAFGVGSAYRKLEESLAIVADWPWFRIYVRKAAIISG